MIGKSPYVHHHPIRLDFTFSENLILWLQMIFGCRTQTHKVVRARKGRLQGDRCCELSGLGATGPYSRTTQVVYVLGRWSVLAYRCLSGSSWSLAETRDPCKVWRESAKLPYLDNEREGTSPSMAITLV